jgi:hypothetical protein
MNRVLQLDDWSTAMTEPTRELAWPRAPRATELDGLPVDRRRPSDMPASRPFPWLPMALLFIAFLAAVRAFGR